jgi:hypothetical protein
MKVYILLDLEDTPADCVESAHLTREAAEEAENDLKEMCAHGRMTKIIEVEVNHSIAELVSQRLKLYENRLFKERKKLNLAEQVLEYLNEEMVQPGTHIRAIANLCGIEFIVTDIQHGWFKINE